MDPRAGLTHQLSPSPSAILWILWVSYPRANLVIENGRLWYKQVVTFYFQLPYLTKGTVLFFLTSIPYNIPDVIIAQRAELPNIVQFSDFFFFFRSGNPDGSAIHLWRSESDQVQAGQRIMIFARRVDLPISKEGKHACVTNINRLIADVFVLREQAIGSSVSLCPYYSSMKSGQVLFWLNFCRIWQP